MKLRCMIPTRNVHLIWVNEKNSAVWSFKNSPKLFRVSYQIIHFFSSNKGSKNVSSKLRTVGAFIQYTKTTSEELSSAYQFSKNKVFFGLSPISPLTFHIKANQNEEQTWSSWCGVAIKWKKIKETWRVQTRIIEWWKFPLRLKCCILILCVEYLSGCFSQQNFKPHLGHWTPSIFPFDFCLPIPRAVRLPVPV